GRTGEAGSAEEGECAANDGGKVDLIAVSLAEIEYPVPVAAAGPGFRRTGIGEDIGTRLPVEIVVPASTIKRVVSWTSFKIIITAATVDDIVAAPSMQVVGVAIARQGIIIG